MINKKVVVLGAGLTGLSAAWHLKNRGIACQIFEKESEVGGLCRSKNIGGFTFDYDGHLLHFRNKSIFNFVQSLLGDNLASHKRNSYIRYKNCEIPYPFQANFLKLPDKVAQECLHGFKKAARIKKRKYRNFKTWAYAYFGKGIAQHFMVAYNEKFWTIPADKLSCAWLDGFIPTVNLKSILSKSDNKQEAFGYNSIFYYPVRGGINELPRALECEIGNNIHLNSNLTEINLRAKKITVNQEKISYNKLISTIPLPDFKNLIKDIPGRIAKYFDLLNYNSILVFNFGIKGKVHNGKHWVYFPEKKFKYFRIGFYSAFSEALAPQGKSSIYVEVSYPKDRVVNINKLKGDIVNNLVKEKFISCVSDVLCSDIVDIKYGYPIYDHKYQIAVAKILDFLSKNGIYSIGRYGSWRYMSMEDALLDGKNISGII